MRVSLKVLVPSVALAAGLVACGDDGVKKSEFIAGADGACTGGNTAISGTAKPTNAPQIVTAADTATTTIDGQVASLRSMKMPGGADRQQIDGIIAAIGQVSGPTKALHDAAGKNDDAAMGKAAAEMQTKADAAAAQAQTYGLRQCGTGLKSALGNLFEGTKSVVKSSYVTKAERLCRETVRKTEALGSPGSSLASTSRYLDNVLALSTKLATDLKALPAPPGDEGTVNDFLTAFDNVNAKGREIVVAAKADNPRLVLALTDEVGVASTALAAKMDAYGLTECGSAAG